VSELAAGDLCVVVETPYDTATDRAAGHAGRTVVLICIEATKNPKNAHMAPYWRCSGLGPGWTGISHLGLRKIPPAPLADEPTEEELTV
jgi:hypothetical protein